MIINLFDAAFAHNLDGEGSSVHGKRPRRFEYIRGRMKWQGITIFTDDMLCRYDAPRLVKSAYKIGWLLECREYKPDNYRRAEELLPCIDMLLTHDAGLLERHPDKCRFVPFGGSWILQPGIRAKSKQVSIIYSAKRFMAGHHLRHAISELPSIERFGHGSAHPVDRKEEGLDDYRFSIAVENSRADNYFTEKLLDCFATGTVPIYWGCPNLDRWFNMDGVITFEQAADIPLILEGANYERMLPAVRDNLERMREFEITDDWIWERVLKALV